MRSTTRKNPKNKGTGRTNNGEEKVIKKRDKRMWGKTGDSEKKKKKKGKGKERERKRRRQSRPAQPIYPWL